MADIYFVTVIHVVAPPSRKKSRSAHLLGCKCPRNGSLSLPTFGGFSLYIDLWASILSTLLKPAVSNLQPQVFLFSGFFLPLQWVSILYFSFC